MHKNTLQHFQRGEGKCPFLPMPAGTHVKQKVVMNIHVRSSLR